MNLYQDEILDHYKHPRHKERLEQLTASAEAANPLCGDKLGLDIRVENGKISAVGYWGEGCAISQASMSMLTEELIDQPVEILNQISQEDIVEMLGVKIGPARLKCALLPLSVLEKLHSELH